MTRDILVKFNLAERGFEFKANGYDFEFLGKSLPSMAVSKGEAVVPIRETFNIFKEFDDNTVALSTICARGLVVPSVEVLVDSKSFKLTHSMFDVRVQSHHLESVVDQEADLWEHFKLSFGKIVWSMERDGKTVSGSNSVDSGGDHGLYL